jgi:hypothetical protein
MADGFRRMAEILKPAQSEHFMVDIFEVTQKDVDVVRLRDLMNRRGEYYGFEPGKYARLSHREANGSRGATIMSDTWMEQQSNLEFVRQARGNVLIAGLGIGMVLLAIQDKPEVNYITVVEKEAEVIELVRSQLPLNGNVTIVNQDIFDFKPDTLYDTIYFDIWDGITADNYPEMKKLHRKLASKRRNGGWMSSWRRRDCQRMSKEDW